MKAFQVVDTLQHACALFPYWFSNLPHNCMAMAKAGIGTWFSVRSALCWCFCAVPFPFWSRMSLRPTLECQWSQVLNILCMYSFVLSACTLVLVIDHEYGISLL
ncbi:hypothetical protein BJV78DRAFT_1238636 [Lactifluus subvellereus]|nr:hypothetical protein BJV78DRAFT_1238636 [Lactifluus subvellereus]